MKLLGWLILIALPAAVLIIIAGSLVFVWFTYFAGPPLSIRAKGCEKMVDVRTFGEYQTNIRRLKIVRVDSQQVIWEMNSERGISIWTFRLHPGTNPTHVGLGLEAEASVPSHQASFSLLPEVPYELIASIMRASGSLRSSSQAFSFPKSCGETDDLRESTETTMSNYRLKQPATPVTALAAAYPGRYVD